MILDFESYGQDRVGWDISKKAAVPFYQNLEQDLDFIKGIFKVL